MIIEMEVAEMDIQVDCLGHMVGADVVEVRITAAEEIVPAMRGKILAMMPPNGIQLPRMEKMVGAVFLVLKFKTHQAGRLSQVVGVAVAVAVAVAVVIVGVVELVAMKMLGGGMQVQMKLVLIMGVLVGELRLREVLLSPKLGMDGREVVGAGVGVVVVVVGETT